MKITSPAFQDNEMIPEKYTCDGDNVNPPLVFSGIPRKAKSLILIVDDPDAIAGIWDHWILFNIDPKVKKIEEGSAPEWGIEAMNSSSKTSYSGPCPPSGTHHYRFTLYALDKLLDLDSSSEKSDLLDAMDGHVLSQAMLTGLYTRE